MRFQSSTAFRNPKTPHKESTTNQWTSKYTTNELIVLSIIVLAIILLLASVTSVKQPDISYSNAIQQLPDNYAPPIDLQIIPSQSQSSNNDPSNPKHALCVFVPATTRDMSEFPESTQKVHNYLLENDQILDIWATTDKEYVWLVFSDVEKETAIAHNFCHTDVANPDEPLSEFGRAKCIFLHGTNLPTHLESSAT